MDRTQIAKKLDSVLLANEENKSSPDLDPPNTYPLNEIDLTRTKEVIGEHGPKMEMLKAWMIKRKDVFKDNEFDALAPRTYHGQSRPRRQSPAVCGQSAAPTWLVRPKGGLHMSERVQK